MARIREWRVVDGAGGAVYVCGSESKGACVGLSSARGLCRACDGVDFGVRRRWRSWGGVLLLGCVGECCVGDLMWAVLLWLRGV